MSSLPTVKSFHKFENIPEKMVLPPRTIRKEVEPAVLAFLKLIDPNLVYLKDLKATGGTLYDSHIDFFTGSGKSGAIIILGKNIVNQVSSKPDFHIIYNYGIGEICIIFSNDLMKISGVQHKKYSYCACWDTIKKNYEKTIFSVKSNKLEREKFSNCYSKV
jgi:hypothetical protein